MKHLKDSYRLHIHLFGVAILTLTCLIFWANDDIKAAQEKDKIHVVTTIQQIGDIARQIAGDYIHLEVLMGAGVDPHLYRPTRSDVISMKEADLILYNGLNLEGQMFEFLEKMKQEKPTIAVADSLPASILLKDEGSKHDPHIWMNVAAWSAVTNVISQALEDALPQYQVEMRTNTTAYKAKLQDLENYVQKAYATIPENQRTLITAHDAFGYLGQAYNVSVVGIQGISTESEAGLNRIEELVNRLVENKIPSVFVETSVSDRNISALIEGAKARGHEVKIGGTLYSDAMGAWDSYTGTYIGMIDHNTTVITRALGGSVPASGMNNKLTLH